MCFTVLILYFHISNKTLLHGMLINCSRFKNTFAYQKCIKNIYLILFYFLIKRMKSHFTSKASRDKIICTAILLF